MSNYAPRVAVSKENGLKIDINHPMTENLLKHPDKTTFVGFEREGKPKTSKSKTDNEQEIV